MKNKLFLILTSWTILYSLIVILFFNAGKEPLNFVGIVAGVGMVAFGGFIALMKPKSDQSGMVQQYIVATTIQILGSLAFILFAKFADPASFKSVAFHYLIAFVVALGIQSVLLIRFINSKSE